MMVMMTVSRELVHLWVERITNRDYGLRTLVSCFAPEEPLSDSFPTWKSNRQMNPEKLRF